MFTRQDLRESFSVVDEGPVGYYFFQHKLPKATYSYSLKTALDRDVLTVSEDANDRKFAAEILDQAPPWLSPSTPDIYTLANNEYGFTHAIAVPSTYHACLKGQLESKRGKLFLCMPIYQCEFSGEETESEFKEMMTRMVPVFRWRRDASPKLKVYFDNPRIGSGAGKNG
ncbi:hypothetical protein [Pseudomonas huanghezhanensis]|uniref:hypothetical protein n=1 Tax=Pseudomonas huanghezhanensis TaxID=3002903 RepID=UPI00228578D3|nr:hypothetical protein [Pseudomonas sp. BSw22131]